MAEVRVGKGAGMKVFDMTVVRGDGLRHFHKMVDSYPACGCHTRDPFNRTYEKVGVLISLGYLPCKRCFTPDERTAIFKRRDP